MARVDIDHKFRSSAARVFAYLAEHENLATVFAARVTRLRDGGDGLRNGVGSARRVRVGLLPAFEESVTEFRPDQLIRHRMSPQHAGGFGGERSRGRYAVLRRARWRHAPAVRDRLSRKNPGCGPGCGAGVRAPDIRCADCHRCQLGTGWRRSEALTLRRGADAGYPAPAPVLSRSQAGLGESRVRCAGVVVRV